MTCRSCHWKRSLLVALTLLFAPVAGDAYAADGDAAAAEQLFREALKLMAKKNYEEACPRLAESQKLDPGYGTLMHLGDCYVKIGKTASAWASYREAVDAARQKKQKARERTAQQKADKLEPKLSKLIIEVPSEAAVEGLVVRRDGQEVGEVSWKSPTPVDPGKHEIEATAPGRLPWSTSIEVGDDETAKVVVSVLQDEPRAKKDEVAKKKTKLHPMAIGGIVLGGVGLAAIGASVGVGFISRSRFDESAAFCAGDFCEPEGLAIRRDALSIANIGTGVFIGGAVLAAAGVTLFIVSPAGKVIEDEKTSIRLRVGPGHLSMEGRF